MKCPKCSAPLETRPIDANVEADACFNCHGVFYDFGEMAVPLKLENPRRGKGLCPKDGAPMNEGALYGGKLILDQCGICGGFWFDSGEIAKLRRLAGTEHVVGEARASPPAPAGQGLAAKPAAGIGMLPPIPIPGLSSISPARPGFGVPRQGYVAPEKAQLKQRRVEPVDSTHQANPDQRQNPVMVHDGREYKHFQTSFPVVTYVVGEFNWKAAVGDTAKARDFISPPHILSQDVTKDEQVWSEGFYVDPEEIWQGFGLKGEAPIARDVSPAQVNPHDETKSSVFKWAILYVFAAIGLFVGLVALARNDIVHNQSYSYNPAEAGAEASFVTPEFELKGARANVEIEIRTNLDNQWAFYRLALINTGTDVALDIDREVSYYHGVDGGESWSEGSQHDTVYLSMVPGGNYYLRVEPQCPGTVSYGIRVTRDVPRIFYLLIALSALVSPVLWVWWRHFAFEKQRWAESDHPLVTEEDE